AFAAWCSRYIIRAASLGYTTDGILTDAQISSDPAIAAAFRYQSHHLRCQPVRFRMFPHRVNFDW
ncbi:hypothetical protein J3U99_23000, partial [Brucella pituitosa]|uniref:hypothetical protein n=1 Tax=Brucella pituitosa TaxID=571256 RepID=UPI0020036C12